MSLLGTLLVVKLFGEIVGDVSVESAQSETKKPVKEIKGKKLAGGGIRLKDGSVLEKNGKLTKRSGKIKRPSR